MHASALILFLRLSRECAHLTRAAQNKISRIGSTEIARDISRLVAWFFLPSFEFGTGIAGNRISAELIQCSDAANLSTSASNGLKYSLGIDGMDILAKVSLHTF